MEGQSTGEDLTGEILTDNVLTESVLTGNALTDEAKTGCCEKTVSKLTHIKCHLCNLWCCFDHAEINYRRFIMHLNTRNLFKCMNCVDDILDKKVADWKIAYDISPDKQKQLNVRSESNNAALITAQNEAAINSDLNITVNDNSSTEVIPTKTDIVAHNNNFNINKKYETNKKDINCKFFLSGYCAFGSECNYKHQKLRKFFMKARLDKKNGMFKK